MILGFVTAAFLLLACAKFFFRKRHGKAIRITHMAFGVGALIASVAHLLSVLPMWRQRPPLVWITGFVCMLILALVILCPIIKCKKWFRWHKILAALSIIIMIGHISVNFIALLAYKQAAASISVPDLDISQISDGKYQGECDIEFIYAKVEVTVESGEIKGIGILEHGNERGKAAEAITSDMINQQKVDVDAISSATNSSKVIKMAVYNALTQGIKVK